MRNLPGPGDFWHQEPGYHEDEPRRRAEREPRDPEPTGLYTGTCLRWNPLTGRAEPGTFTVHPDDFIGGAA